MTNDREEAESAFLAYVNADSLITHLGRRDRVPPHDAFTLCAQPVASYDVAAHAYAPSPTYVELERTSALLEYPDARACKSCIRYYNAELAMIKGRIERQQESDLRQIEINHGFRMVQDGLRELRSSTRNSGSDARFRAALVVIEDILEMHKNERG